MMQTQGTYDEIYCETLHRTLPARSRHRGPDYAIIAIPASGFAFLFTGLAMTVLSIAFFSKLGIPDLVLLGLGVAASFGALVGTLKFFFRLDMKRHGF